MKHIAPLFSFLFSFFGVAFIVGLALLLVFPTKEAAVVGIGIDWRNLPGSLLGIWAGVYAWKASIRSAEAAKAKKQAKEEAKKNKPRSSIAYPRS